MLAIFAIVLLFTGSLLINMYIQCSDNQSKFHFHFGVGISGIVVGVGCLAYMITVVMSLGRVKSAISYTSKDATKLDSQKS